MRLDIRRIEGEGCEVVDKYDGDLIVIKNFCPTELCEKAVKKVHFLMKEAPHRKESNGTFFSFDVLSMNTQTNRIFRTMEFKDFDGLSFIG